MVHRKQGAGVLSLSLSSEAMSGLNRGPLANGAVHFKVDDNVYGGDDGLHVLINGMNDEKV